jgi:hypothetical protein
MADADNIILKSKSIIKGANEFGGVGTNTAFADLRKGGQLGVGFNAANLDAASPLPFSPTFFIVLHLPTMYDSDKEFGKMLKSIIENCPKQISGIDFGYQLDVAKTPNGHDSQEQSTPTKTKRSAVNPSMVFQEVTGNLIWNVFRKWIFDINDPDTYASMAHIQGGAQNYVSSAYSMTCMAIQFDPTMAPEQIIDAAIYTNMFPTQTDNIGFERNIGNTVIRERTIQFEAIVRHNAYVRSLAVQIAKQLQLAKADYRYAVPEFDYASAKSEALVDNGIWSDVNIAKGYKSDDDAIGKTGI